MNFVRKILNYFKVKLISAKPVDTNKYGLNGKYKEEIFLLSGASVSHCCLEGKHEFGYDTVIKSSTIGLGSYIAHNSSIKFTKIGRFCSIGENVRTYVGQHPSKDFVSSHPIFYSKQFIVGKPFADKSYFEEHSFVDERHVVEIGNDVWIGNNVTILDGVKISDGAVIASGAIVNKDVKPYEIVGGIPAKVIKRRFEEEEIRDLLRIRWWNWEFDQLKLKYKDFHSIKEFVKNYPK